MSGTKIYKKTYEPQAQSENLSLTNSPTLPCNLPNWPLRLHPKSPCSRIILTPPRNLEGGAGDTQCPVQWHVSLGFMHAIITLLDLQ